MKKFTNLFLLVISILFSLTNAICPIYARMDETVEDWKYIGTGTAWCAYKPALDQPPKGTIFHSERASFGWSDSSRTSGSGSISVSINGVPISVGISYTPGVAGGSHITRNFGVPKRL